MTSCNDTINTDMIDNKEKACLCMIQFRKGANAPCFMVPRTTYFPWLSHVGRHKNLKNGKCGVDTCAILSKPSCKALSPNTDLTLPAKILYLLLGINNTMLKAVT